MYPLGKRVLVRTSEKVKKRMKAWPGMSLVVVEVAVLSWMCGPGWTS